MFLDGGKYGTEWKWTILSCITYKAYRYKNFSSTVETLKIHCRHCLRLLERQGKEWENKVILPAQQHLGSYISINSLLWKPLGINVSQVVKIYAETCKLHIPLEVWYKIITRGMLNYPDILKLFCWIKQKHQCQVYDLSYNLNFVSFCIHIAQRVEYGHISNISGGISDSLNIQN